MSQKLLASSREGENRGAPKRDRTLLEKRVPGPWSREERSMSLIKRKKTGERITMTSPPARETLAEMLASLPRSGCVIVFLSVIFNYGRWSLFDLHRPVSWHRLIGIWKRSCATLSTTRLFSNWCLYSWQRKIVLDNLSLALDCAIGPSIDRLFYHSEASGLGMALPLKVASNLRISLHQNDPFLTVPGNLSFL